MSTYSFINRLARCVAGLLIPALGGVALAQGSQSGAFLGFDRNDYPGDATLPALRRHFEYVGYWLTNPPGEKSNSWVGKRLPLRTQGFGFLLLADGRTDAQIKAGGDAIALGRRDGATAVASALHEGFANGAILFLDQEEGGRLLQEQSDYLFAWTEAVFAAGYRAGVYASGQAVNDGDHNTITTAQDIQQQVVSRHVHPVAMWVYQDGCPPANGCTLKPLALSASGTAGADVWQFAQSPRRKSITAACAKTYAADGNCYVSDPVLKGIFLDLNVANSPDPSHGR